MNEAGRPGHLDASRVSGEGEVALWVSFWVSLLGSSSGGSSCLLGSSSGFLFLPGGLVRRKEGR